MPIQIDYEWARAILDNMFLSAVNDLRSGFHPSVPEDVDAAVQIVFASRTQAYREVLLGSALARLADRSIDIRSPYAKQGEYAYNGRTLDEKVINPFFHENRIPSTKQPFLSVFRRSVRFTEATGAGMRDRPRYDAFLA